MHLPNGRLRKTWLAKCVKSPVSEDSSTVNMLKGSNTVEIYTTTLLS